MRNYLNLLRNRNFALLWSGLTISQLGDGLSWVALVWFIYELTDSPLALGIFLMFYTAPTILGGLVAGVLLDRFDRRKLLIVDNLIRAVAIGLIPLFHLLGILQLWHIYLAAFVYGSLMMLSLAGGPAIVPTLVKKDELNTANALESISWSLGDIIGRALAGVLIGFIGAPNVLILDVMTYLIFVVNLYMLRLPAVQQQSQSRSAPTGRPGVRLIDGFQFIYQNKLIFAITVAFLILNLGAGALGVLLPIYSDEIIKTGAQGFGLLVASISAGQLLSSLVAGGVQWKYPLGRSIAVTVILLAGSFGALYVTDQFWMAFGALFVFGFFIAPANIWAQTIRMRIIPEELRGRVFSILRTIIRSSLPLASSLFGLLIPSLGILNAILLATLLMGLPGLIALLTGAFAENERQVDAKVSVEP